MSLNNLPETAGNAPEPQTLAALKKYGRHLTSCNVNNQQAWDEAQAALNECQMDEGTSIATVEIARKRTKCSCGFEEVKHYASRATAPSQEVAPALPTSNLMRCYHCTCPCHDEKERCENCCDGPVRRIHGSVVYKGKCAEPAPSPATKDTPPEREG